MYITMALAGIAWATINVNSYPMVVEMANNKKHWCLYWLLLYCLNGSTNYNTNAFWIDYGFNKYYAVFISILLHFFYIRISITMIFVKHGDSKPIPSKSIHFED